MLELNLSRTRNARDGRELDGGIDRIGLGTVTLHLQRRPERRPRLLKRPSRALGAASRAPGLSEPLKCQGPGPQSARAPSLLKWPTRAQAVEASRAEETSLPSILILQ